MNSENLANFASPPENDPTREAEQFKRDSLVELALQLQQHVCPGYPGLPQRYFRDNPPTQPTISRGTWDAGEIIPTASEHIAIRNLFTPLDSWGRPVHVWLSDMVSDPAIGVATGKGAYYHWGPNYTADPIVIQAGHLLLVQRSDTALFALPGGFVDPGESAAQAARRETREEAAVQIPPEIVPIEVYCGPVADIRMTAHAWPETTALLFDLGDDMPCESGWLASVDSETTASAWVPLEHLLQLELFGSHRLLIQLALQKLQASETAYLPSGE
jgi:ADP-ribose pyrophosphatase YjhB (NUDIX family)